ncbi:MAG: hypothetical protein MRY78_02590 [Saprospiraceae bacterium]|nr:hypothetical protein [Saprospiraceae bacterium]
MKIKVLLLTAMMAFSFGLQAQKAVMQHVMIVLSLSTDNMELLDNQLSQIDTEQFTFWKVQACADGKTTIKLKINANVSLEGLSPEIIEQVDFIACPQELKRHRLNDVAGLVDIQLKSEEDFWGYVTR